MSALDQITGLIPVALGAGLAMKVTDSMFSKVPQATRRKKSSRKRKSVSHPGNFSNVLGRGW